MNAMNPDPPVSQEELSGRIIELLELNNALTQRCANMRGRMAVVELENSKILRELAHCRAREEERKNSSSEAKIDP